MSPVATTTPMPDRLYMKLDGIDADRAKFLAVEAVEIARRNAPKLTGVSASRLIPVWGDGVIGIRWLDSYVWFQESGIKPFTMRSLAGKTIPMWIDDPTGKERRANPDAKTRVTASGKTQVLIFRRAARIGATKQVHRRQGGRDVVVTVPQSYPGAPGRIAVREAPRPYTTPGRVGGQIAQGNVGVRWRFPGMAGRQFIHYGLQTACQRHGILPGQVLASSERWKSTFERRAR